MIDTLNIDTMEYDFIRGKMIFNLKEFVMHNSKRTKKIEIMTSYDYFKEIVAQWSKDVHKLSIN